MKCTKPLLLLLLLAASTHVLSCQQTAPAETDSTAASGIEAALTTEASNEDAYQDALPEFDFQGREFRVLAAESAYYKGYIDVDEETGTVLNDAIYKSNRTAEERFNFVIKQELQDAVTANNIGQKTIMAADDVYDIISLTDRLALTIAVQGMLISYENMPYIDLEKSYWCTGINESITIGGNQWLAYSDFNLSVYDYTFVMTFNKQLLGELQLDDPYALVNSGKWTYDVFNEMCLQAVTDLNGDGSMTEADRYGWSGDSKQMLPCMWVAAGVTPIQKDKDDLPVYTLPGDETFNDVYEKIVDVTWSNNVWYPNFDMNITEDTMFRDGNALFQTTSFGLLDSDYYREMQIDFGILPHPKYDESQSSYYSRVEGGRLFAIPVTNGDTEFTGVVLEALSGQAAKDIIPAYFEITLKTKYTRDDESAKMFDLIMDTRVYDLADTFWCEQLRDGFLRDLFKKGSRDLASAAESNRSKVEKKLQETIDALTQ